MIYAYIYIYAYTYVHACMHRYRVVIQRRFFICNHVEYIAIVSWVAVVSILGYAGLWTIAHILRLLDYCFVWDPCRIALPEVITIAHMRIVLRMLEYCSLHDWF